MIKKFFLHTLSFTLLQISFGFHKIVASVSTITVSCRSFIILKILLCFTYSFLFPLFQIFGNHWSFYQFFFLEDLIIGTIYVAFSYWRFSLCNIHLSFMSFLDLIVYLLLLKNIPFMKVVVGLSIPHWRASWFLSVFASCE